MKRLIADPFEAFSMKRVLVFLGLFIALSPAYVLADMITYQSSFSLQSSDWLTSNPIPTGGPGTVNQPLPFNQFNNNLGSLNDVTITLEGDFTWEVTLSCTTCSIASGSASVNAGLWTIPDIHDNYGIGTSGGAVLNSGGYLIGTIGQSGSENFIRTASILNMAPSEMYRFIGTSSYNLLAELELGFGSFDYGLVDPAHDIADISAFGTFDGIVTVEYDYTPPPPATVPEPSTFILLGAGLTGLGFVVRRRRKE